MIGVLLVNPLVDALDTNKATIVLYDYFANSTTSIGNLLGPSLPRGRR